jgi:hypothetical protein
MGADPEPAPIKQCGMRNGECGMVEPKAPQIRMLRVIYITCRAATQDLSRASQQIWEK